MAFPNNHGVGIAWSMQGITFSLSGSFKNQGADYKSTADKVKLWDDNGQTAAICYTDGEESVTFDSVPVAVNGLSASIAQQSVGASVTVTSPIDTWLGGTSWKLDEVGVKWANKDYAKFTCQISRVPGVT